MTTRHGLTGGLLAPLFGWAMLLGLALTPGCAGTSAADKAAEARQEELAGQTLAAQTAARHQAAVEAEALAYARQHQATKAGSAQPGPNAAIAAKVAAAEAADDKAANEAARAAEAQRQSRAQAEAEAAKAKTASAQAAAAVEAANAQADAQSSATAAKAKADAQGVEQAAKAAAAAATASAAATAASTSTATAAAVEDFTGLVAEIVTSKGTLVLVLRADKAPGHVKNFVDLSRSHFYDGLTFQRIIPGYMIQGGDPKGDGSGGPGYQIKAEFNDLPHLRGTLSMARGGHPDSAGSQFFICHADKLELDGKYTVFGMLVKGFDTLDAIAAEGSPGGAPREKVLIQSITIRKAQPDEQLKP